jgi:hypothetical protein
MMAGMATPAMDRFLAASVQLYLTYGMTGYSPAFLRKANELSQAAAEVVADEDSDPGLVVFARQVVEGIGRFMDADVDTAEGRAAVDDLIEILGSPAGDPLNAQPPPDDKTSKPD